MIIENILNSLSLLLMAMFSPILESTFDARYSGRRSA